MKKPLGSIVAVVAASALLLFQNCSGFRMDEMGGDSSRSLSGDPIPDVNLTTEEGYDILVVAGQSNAVGFGCGAAVNASTTNDARIFQVTPDLQIALAQDPLMHRSTGGNGVGFAMTFARHYASTVPANRQILIVPSARGATSILQWDDVNEGINFEEISPLPLDSTELWDNLVRRTQFAKARPGKNRVVAFLWHQGENDYSMIKMTGRGFHARMSSDRIYQDLLHRLVYRMRLQLGDGRAVPFIAGELGDFWGELNGSDPGLARLRSFNQAVRAVGDATLGMAVVSANGLQSNEQQGCLNDAGHFSSAAQVEFGGRYFAAYQRLMNYNFQKMPVPALIANATGFRGFAIAAGTSLSCDQLNPDAIKALDPQTIEWLGALQPSGITLHENYLIARQLGYTGAFGQGEHNAYLDGSAARRSEFESSVASVSATAIGGYRDVKSHHLAKRAAGYRGLFLCGGGACYESGACDAWGRRR